MILWIRPALTLVVFSTKIRENGVSDYRSITKSLVERRGFTLFSGKVFIFNPEWVMLKRAMNPQSPQGITPPPINYEFILNQNQKQARFNGGGKKQRVVAVVFVGLVLLVIGIIFMAILGSAKSKGSAELLDLAAYQTELQRVIAIGAEDGSSSVVRGTALVASYSLQNDLQTTMSLLKQKGVKTDPKILAKYRSGELDAKLSSAKTANTFDSTYKTLFDEKMINYQKKLKDVYASQQGVSTQASLRNYSAHAKLLVFNYQPEQKSE